MAGIATQGDSHGGRRAVDSEIPLVPFIDLLLCCIMFLLVTAVWNQLARVDAHLDAPGGPASIAPPPARGPLIVQLTAAGFHVATDAGEATDIPRLSNGELDRGALERHLLARRRADPQRQQVLLSPDDGIDYAQVVATMDTFTGAGYEHVNIGGAP